MTKTPTIIQILPVKMQTPETIEIYQITVKFEYEIDNQALIDYIVFERSATMLPIPHGEYAGKWYLILTIFKIKSNY